MNQPVTTFFGNVRLSYDYNAMVVPNNMEFLTVRTTHQNRMSKPVTMQLRSGATFVFPAVSGPHAIQSRNTGDREFLVIRECEIARNAYPQTYSFFSRVTENDSTELKLMAENFMTQYHTHGQTALQLRIVVIFAFTEDDLINHGGGFYHDELDVLFVMGDGMLPYPHPHSRAGREDRLLRGADEIVGENGFISMVEIIDSSGKYGDRYLNIFGKIVRIRKRKDNNKPDGIYIVSSKPTIGALTSESMVVTHYKFGEAEKALGLYKTYELAESYGDPTLSRKEAIAEMEHRIQVARNETEISKQLHASAKIEAERLLLERDSQIKNLEHERTTITKELDSLKERQDFLIDQQRARTKETFEERAAARKDSSEMLKYLPVVLAAIGTILMSIKAFKK